MDYVELFGGLGAAGVRYLVAGRVALNLHGIPRMTYDLDLVADLEAENLLRLIRTLQGWGYVCRGVPSPEEAALEGGRLRLIAGGTRVLRFASGLHEAGEVDVALETAGSWEAVRGRAVPVKIGGRSVPVMAEVDLKAVKRRMGRPEDDDDLKGLTVLGEVLAGDERALASEDLHYDQIRKFRRWEPEKRLEWLVAGRQLRRDSHGGGPKGPSRGKGALKRGRLRGIDHYQDLT